MRKPPKQNRHKSEQSVQTPPEFIAAVKRLLCAREFGIDLAASAENTQAKRYYSVTDDALMQPWRSAGWSWLNPEYGNIAPWVERAWSQSRVTGGAAHVAVLIPAAVGSNWWRDSVDRKALALALNGRIRFVGQKDPYPKDCALLLYGPFVTPGLHVWTWPDATHNPGGLFEV